jgi:uncharacterized membrane protein YoaK (UPF0700 family)
LSDAGRRDALLVALTFAAGAVDAVAFLGLGVFTAVMTGNLVLLGVAIGQGAARNALRGLVAVGGYGIGVLAGARIVGVVPRETLWSRAVTRALMLEAALQAVFLSGWVVTDATPDGIAALALITVSGIAMGLQAATTRGVAPGRSTTYLTGTLTGLLTELSALGVRPDWWHRAAIVIALVFGALIGAVAFITAPSLAPAIPLGILAIVVLIAVAGDRATPSVLRR